MLATSELCSWEVCTGCSSNADAEKRVFEVQHTVQFTQAKSKQSCVHANRYLEG
jgi:hypothetical protein